MLPWLDVSARIVNRRCRFTRLRHTLPAEDGPAANISINLASIFTYSRRAGNRANGQAWSIPVLRLGLSRGLTGFGLQVRVGPGSIPSVLSTLSVNSPLIETLDASPSDENSTEFSKHPRNYPTTHVGPRSKIPSLSRGIPGPGGSLPV